jgi:hypothetical protein
MCCTCCAVMLGPLGTEWTLPPPSTALGSSVPVHGIVHYLNAASGWVLLLAGSWQPGCACRCQLGLPAFLAGSS